MPSYWISVTQIANNFQYNWVDLSGANYLKIAERLINNFYLPFLYQFNTSWQSNTISQKTSPLSRTSFSMELSPSTSSYDTDTDTAKCGDLNTLAIDQKSRGCLQRPQSPPMSAVWIFLKYLWTRLGVGFYKIFVHVSKLMHCKLPFYQLQNFMSNIVDSPLVQARQIMSLSPTSPTQMHGSSQPSNLDQLIMPIHQITQTQKQPILSDSGISNIILIQCFF